MREDAINEYSVGPLYIFHLASQSMVIYRVAVKAFLEKGLCN